MGILGLPANVEPGGCLGHCAPRPEEGFSDVSFRFGGRRTLPWIALGLILPIVVGTLAYGTAWLMGLVGFDPQPAGLVARFVRDNASPVTVFVVWLALATTIGV